MKLKDLEPEILQRMIDTLNSGFDKAYLLLPNKAYPQSKKIKSPLADKLIKESREDVIRFITDYETDRYGRVVTDLKSDNKIKNALFIHMAETISHELYYRIPVLHDNWDGKPTDEISREIANKINEILLKGR